MEYTKLEQAVLNWMSEHMDIPNLQIQIQAAVPTKRENTGHGSYTSLSVPSDSPAIDFPSPISGPAIEAIEIEHGGAALLFLDNLGEITLLEMYANGDRFGESISSFQLKRFK